MNYSRYNINLKGYSAVQTNSSLSKPVTIISIIGILIGISIIVFAFLNANITYYYSIQELKNDPSLQNQRVKISGAVIGDTITTDFSTGEISFLAVHIPVDQDQIEQNGGLELVLHNATLDESLPNIQIVYQGIRPELLVNESQVIASGTLNQNNIFIADELLLKCPSKYEEKIENK